MPDGGGGDNCCNSYLQARKLVNTTSIYPRACLFLHLSKTLAKYRKVHNNFCFGMLTYLCEIVFFYTKYTHYVLCTLSFVKYDTVMYSNYHQNCTV